MQRNVAFLAICLVLTSSFSQAAESQAKVTPVQKVIQLLEGMVEKGKEEKHAEQQQYAGYKQFCDDTSASKGRAIEEAAAAIEKLDAEIAKYTSDAETLATEIAQHEQDIANWTKDQEAATKVREVEHNEYLAIHKDYEESLDALTRAVEYIKVQAKDTPGAPSASVLLQQVYKTIPENLKEQIDAFLASDPAVGEEANDAELLPGVTKAKTNTGLLQVNQPTANAYEFQSQGIIDMLEKLKDKFQNEVDKVREEEVKARNQYDTLMQDLRDQLSTATDSIATKKQIRADTLEAKAVAEADLEETQATKEADEKYKADLDATCEQKAADFEARQQLRDQEIEAIEKAIEILAGDSVSGAAERHLPTFLEMKTTTQSSLVQLRSHLRSPNQERVAAFLKEKAMMLNSKVLSTLADSASADPFAKVKQLIQALITRLMEEANEEAEHKGWCDQELATNAQTRKKKAEQVELLTSEIDELEASMAQLTTEIEQITAEVADLDAAVAENTRIREEEKAKNTVAIEEAQEAQKAVADALAVLKEFYAKAAEAKALLQKQQPEAPEIFDDEPYKGMQGASTGPIGLLEVIQSDFARLESETSAEEAQSAKEYDQFMSDSAVNKAQKTKDLSQKNTKRQNQKAAKVEKTEDLEMTQGELDKAMAYYEKLKPSCIAEPMSYEERKARREEEIAALQEALRILSGEDIAGAL